MEKKLILKPGREKSLLRRHPWIFSGAVQKVTGDPEKGDTLTVESSKGDFLGRCGYNPESSIRGRMWTFKEEEICAGFFKNILRIAISLRKEIDYLNASNDSCRLVHGESDGLPGLIVDRYANYLVVQFLTASIDKWRVDIVQALADLTEIGNVYERSDVDVRRLEGLEERKGVLMGKEPPELIQIVENGLKFLVDIRNGQKTGFYLDQRENRGLFAEYAKERCILNCFAYTGGFTFNALKGGSLHVTSIESSQDAIDIALRNQDINNLNNEKADWICGDVFQELRKLRDSDKKFDAIILDPPKLAPTASFAQAAARGYKDINLLAFKLLEHGGILFTFSCSGGISRELFKKIISDAALDAGADVSIIRQLTQFQDHPISLTFPEGEYLKGFVCIKK